MSFAVALVCVAPYLLPCTVYIALMATVFVLGSKVWNLKSPTQVCYDSLDLPQLSVRAEGRCPLRLCA